MAINSNSGGGAAHGDKAGTFEESFARLQEVVTKLSEGNLTLQEALNAYEEGMELAVRCAGMLDEAELRVKQVSDRALKAGSAALADMTMLGEQITQTSNGNAELVAIEIERYETTLVFEDPPAPKPAQRQGLRPVLDDLDPLFDDE